MRVVQVLDVDADLCSALPLEQREQAKRVAWAPSVALEEGPCDVFWPPEPGALGALIVGGLITVRLSFGEVSHIELLGPGDVISTNAGFNGGLVPAPVVTACAPVAAQLAVLDRRFAERVARWPEVTAAVLERLVERARRASLQAAINSLPRTDDRLELTFWQIAERLGRVTPRGITLCLPITQTELGELIGARRPSVTTGLRRLIESGRVSRTGRHSWLLRGAPPDGLGSLVRESALAA